jgi:hypothetical protein
MLLLEVATGKDRRWLEHPSESITFAGAFGSDSRWIAVQLQALGSAGGVRWSIVPWREEPVPLSEWIEVKGPLASANYSAFGDFFQYFQNGKFMAVRFDPKTRAVSQPYEVKFPPGTGETVRPTDGWSLRGPGLLFSRRESTSSVWLMKLPD